MHSSTDFENIGNSQPFNTHQGSKSFLQLANQIAKECQFIQFSNKHFQKSQVANQIAVQKSYFDPFLAHLKYSCVLKITFVLFLTCACTIFLGQGDWSPETYTM
jgi:hypothetical protein